MILFKTKTYKIPASQHINEIEEDQDEKENKVEKVCVQYMFPHVTS